MEKIKRVETEEELQACSNLRKHVFGDEEGADEKLYVIDEADRLKKTSNFLIASNGKYVGTGRYTEVDAKIVRIQRMAVLKEYRGRGLASKLLKFMENDMQEAEYHMIVLDSASSARAFYLSNHYEVVSAEFYEDDRPHITMRKELRAK